jgi:hypothetical protein
MATSAVKSPPSRRQVLEISWVVGVVLFTLGRFVVAYSTLARFSRATVIIFGIVDLVTAVPYGLGTARVVTNLVDRHFQGALRWGIVACVSFLAPYLWLAWAGRESFPTYVYVVIAILAVLMGAYAIRDIIRRVRADAGVVGGDVPGDVLG